MRRLFLLIAASLLFFCEAGLAQTLPSGFTTSIIGSDWNLPLGATFTTDGQKLFVWEKDGRVYVCNRNASGAYIKQTTPVLDISEEVANWGDHGLMGFALDPNYLSNGLIYLLYVVDRHYLINFGTPAYNPATSTRGGTIGRNTRYKTITNGPDLATDLSSRFILLGETKTTGIALTHDSHGLGTLAFAADGTLLATCGDGGSYYAVDKGSDPDTDYDLDLIDGILRPEENVGAFRAQMLNCHNGKLLRIDPTTGNGVSSNPYYNAAEPRSPKSRVWAFGLRNPFRMSVKPGTGSTNPAAGDIGEIYIGDVGWNTYEEVNVITTPGVNCGWPLFEGMTPTPGYSTALTANRDEPNPLYGINGCTKQFFDFQDLVRQPTADNDKSINNPCSPLVTIGTGERYIHHRPILDWQHFVDTARVPVFSGNNVATALIGTPESGVNGVPFQGNCSIGGPWYSGSNFPAEYSNHYFVADHDQKWIRAVGVDFTDVVTEVKNFGGGFLGTVCITMNPLDGSMVVVELGDFASILPTIKQIKYGGNQSPVVKINSDKLFGPSPLAVNFTGINSSDPDGTIAAYAWNFGDGATSAVASPSHSFTAPANTPTKYVVRLTVTDNEGASSTDSTIISVNNTPPVVNITSPVKNSLYKIGPDTLYTCSATVTDAEPGPLKYEWQTFLRHNSHAHPQPISNDVSPTTSIERIGCNGDTYYWMIKLTVTDAAGLSAVDSSKIFPDCNIGPDATPPVVSSVLPANGTSNVNVSTLCAAIFDEAIDAATVTSTSFVLKDANNIVVPGTISVLSNQATFSPSAPLAGSKTYTATVKGGQAGVKDVAGNALVNDYSWSFTTAAGDTTAPVVTSVLPQNGATIQGIGATVTVNFSEAINISTVNATTIQLKDVSNNAVAATINATASQVTLTPSNALANSSHYTVTIKGGASGVKDLAGNALINDYTWSFNTAAADNVPPTITSVSPLNGATGVNIGTQVSANFNEAINAATVTATSFQLRDAGNNLVAVTVTTSSNQVVLTPSAALANSAVYTATIKGGASGVKDLAGNALVNDYTWTFTTGANVGGTSIFLPTSAPAEPHANDGQAIEVGMKFRSSQNGFISGIRYFKDEGFTGTRTGHLWTGTGTLLASVVFTGETFSGWQQMLLSNPVAITANTTYVVSYFSSSGDYAASGNYFTQPVVNGFLHGLANGEDGPNGLYKYSATPVFPANSFNASNYWVDVVFNTGGGTSLPIVSTDPTSQTKCAGASVSFTSAANGSPTPTVHWQQSTNGTTWSDISGATNSTLAFSTTIGDDNKQYRAVWTNSAGSVNTNPCTLTVNSIPAAPSVTVVNNCGNTVLTAGSFTGSLLWSNGATTSSITVATSGSYSVTQTLNGCTSSGGSGVAAPKATPALSSSLAATATSGNAFTYNPTSTSSGTTFGWSRATVPGISNAAANGTGAISETLTTTTGSPVNVTYVYTLTSNGCTNTQNVIVTVNPVVISGTGCTISNTSLSSNFNGTTIPAGRYIWFNSSFDPGPLANGTDPVTITITNGVITFTANNVPYTLNVPNARIRFDATVTTASTQFINNQWETVVPRAYSNDVFMSGLSYLVPVNFPGNYTNVKWATNITIDKPGISLAWRWAAAAYTSFAGNSGINVKPIDGSTQNSYANIDRAGTPENFKTFVVDGAKGTGGTNYTGSFSSISTVSCTPNSPPPSPTVTVVNNCGNSVLTAGSFSGSLLWSNGATTSSITVTTAGTYSVTQTINGSTSLAGTGVAAPKEMATLSSNLSASAASGTVFTYTPASTTSGTTFNWSRASVTGISNPGASGAGTISETLINTTTSPVNVTYVFTLTSNGCPNTQSVVVTVNPAIGCTISDASLTSNFNGTSIPAGRYIWFNSSFDPGPLSSGTDPVTILVTNGVITFTANNVPYSLHVPNARIRFDASATMASTQFINNQWETVVPRAYSSDVFMSGLSYLVPVNIPGNYINVKWTTDIHIDKPGISLGWRWAAAVYTTFAGHSGINVKPINGTTQNPYSNPDRAGSPENFEAYVVSGAKGTGGTNYTGSFSSIAAVSCGSSSQRLPAQLITSVKLPKGGIPELSFETTLTEGLEIAAMPNPSTSNFNVIIKGSNKSPVQLRVTDMFGRLVEHYESVNSNTMVVIGQRLKGGTYFVEVIQGQQRKILKLIKVN